MVRRPFSDAMSSKPSPLANPLATLDQLRWNVSGDTVSGEVRDLIKYEASRLISTAGILLRLPQNLIAQAIVLLCRYWTTPGISMLDHDARVRHNNVRLEIADLCIGFIGCCTVPCSEAIGPFHIA